MNAAALVLSLLLSQSEPADAQVTGDREAARRQAASELAREVVSRYTIAESDDASAPPAVFERHPDPILRWSNPAAGSIYGDVYVWTSRGRPGAIACVYRWYDPHRSQVAELHSVSTRPLTLTYGERRIWAPPAGVEFREIDAAAPPAATAVGRLRQMRSLAEEFSVELEDTRSGENAVPRRLRMLTQPVFRYGGGTGSPDGALFAFVEGTDPEAWLMIETDAEAVSPRWRFAFARMNNDVLRGVRRGAEVWKVERTEDALANPENSPYALFFVTDVPWRDAPPSDAEERRKD